MTPEARMADLQAEGDGMTPDDELTWARLEIEYLQESGRRLVAERDALQRKVDAARDLGQEWRRLSGLGEPLSTHSLAAASPAMRTLWEVASDLLAALGTVEPADQPHPTPPPEPSSTEPRGSAMPNACTICGSGEGRCGSCADAGGH